MMYKSEVIRWVALVVRYLRCESPILQVWDENAIPIPLGRYSDCLKRDRWNSLPNGVIKTPFRFHSADIATASNETDEIRYQMALLKMPFRFHSVDVATASNETGEIRYQMAFYVLYNFLYFLSNLFFSQVQND